MGTYMLCFVQKKLYLTLFLALSITSLDSVATETEYYPPELAEQLHSAFLAKGINYKPRTQHFVRAGIPAYTNQLILQDSPYLLQHAHNPVHWYPWSDAAFAKAKAENKPVFLSIGYSTCHWCHVMEEESFDNPEIAAVLNKYFIAIKVDRESRPDIDNVYMEAVMLLTGRGGWPMSNFLTPEGKTFYGASYIPPEPFKTLLLQVNEVWNQHQAEVLKNAEEIANAVANTHKSSEKSQAINLDLLQQTAYQLIASQDTEYGGFGVQTKFPNELLLALLLDDYQRFDDKNALATVEGSLQAMAQGGIYDQVGAGFHRYATDRKWLVPHFEKMLYSQAQLTHLYLQAFQLTGKAEYARIARQTLGYVLHDMQAGNGGFYSASDADSNGVEGEYYVWTIKQIKQALSPQLADLAIDLYGVTPQGNFDGHSILYLPVSMESYAQQHNIKLTGLLTEVEAIRSGLKVVRQKRIPPLLDDKVVTAWNAMMIESLVLASEVLKHPGYLQLAEKTANWIWENNYQPLGDLKRIYWRGNFSVSGSQQDYAYYASALISLYDQTGNHLWLDKAMSVTDKMIKKFWDEQQGGFFMNTTAGNKSLIVRPKDIKDHVIPSANAVAASVLEKLSRRTENFNYQNKAAATLAAFSTKIITSPTSFSRFLSVAADLNKAETGRIQYAAKGAARVQVGKNNSNQLRVIIELKPGWHINSNQPLQSNLIPTKINVVKGNIAKINYPSPIIEKLGFSQQVLSLYEKTISITGKIIDDDKHYLDLKFQVQLQACNDKHCLAPETLQFRL